MEIDNELRLEIEKHKDAIARDAEWLHGMDRLQHLLDSLEYIDHDVRMPAYSNNEPLVFRFSDPVLANRIALRGIIADKFPGHLCVDWYQEGCGAIIQPHLLHKMSLAQEINLTD